MVSKLPFHVRPLGLAVQLAILLAGLAPPAVHPAHAQQRPVHYFHRADLPPGTVGQGQLLRGGPLAGYFQPVEIRAPEGTLITLAADGYLQPPTATVAKAGMLIGHVYRFKVGNIPGQPGAEVYPTIELVNRLFPPPGQAMRYPIPIELTQQELELAIRGAYVTRVVYLENPEDAFPVAQQQQQQYFDVGERTDPLQAADELGRPMAILRMGSRIPATDTASGQCMFETPPIMLYPRFQPEEMAQDAAAPAGFERADERALPQSRRTVLEAYRANIPRVPLPPGGFTSGERRTTTRR